jgi:antitoxin component of MazEF toxin-antitoxin module
MKLTKWGNSYGLRIPVDLIQKLKWAPGDEFQVIVSGEDQLLIVPDRSRQQALELFRKHRVKLPERYVFDRDEIYGN